MTDAEIDALLRETGNAAMMHPVGRIGVRIAERLATELRSLRARIPTETPDPSHVFCGGPLDCCIHCEAFRGRPLALLPCARSTAGKLEYCCECGAEYPRSDLLAGHIYCSACRAAKGR